MSQFLREHPLEHLPKLWKWFRGTQVSPPTHPAEVLLWNVTRGLVTPGREGARAWLNGVEQFVRSSADPRNDYVLADSLSQELGCPLAEHMSTICEAAIVGGDGQRAMQALLVLSSKVSLSVVRFLAAWTALNVGDLETCINECEKEHEPHAPIYTLLGQALLETGRATEAVDALKVSVKIDPRDALAMFQLIKAYLVLNRTNEAAEAANRCRVITGPNVEIECLSAMIVLADQGQNQKFAEQTLQRLSDFFREDPGNLDLMTLAFDVADVKGDQMALSAIFQTADMVRLSRRPDFTKKVSHILRKLGEKQWFGLSQQLTEKVLSSSPQAASLMQ